MNVNKVFIAGRLTRDPELRYSVSGTAIVSFGVANNHTWKGADDTSHEEACFIDVNMFGKRAEVINEHFSKGSSIFIEGRLQLNQWETKEGQKRSVIRIVANDFQFVGDRQAKRTDFPQGAGSSKEDIDSGDIPF